MQRDAGPGGGRTGAPARQQRLNAILPLLLALQQGPSRTQVGPVTVVADPGRLAAAADLARAAAQPASWPGLGTLDPLPFRLVLVGDSAELAAISRGQAPGWGAGLAFPDSRTIVLRADLPEPVLTLRHELAHLILHRMVPVRVPLWFDEGYASWAGGEWDRLAALRLNLALAGMRSPELREVDAMLRGNASSASAAYALAVTAVLELARRNPSHTLGPLFDRLRSGEGFEPSVIATTGLTLDRFEEEWQRRLRRDYNILTWLVAGGMWAVVAFLMAGALWYRRRADRPRRAALDQGWMLPGDTVPPPERPPASSDVDPAAPG